MANKNDYYETLGVSKSADNDELKSTIGADGIGKYREVSEVGITDGLVGYWKLDGDAKDYSGSGYDGTVFGAVSTAGLKNTAYDFNYVALDRISISTAPPVTNRFTISAWVYSNNIANSQNVVSRNGPYFMRIVSSKVRFNVLAGGTWLFQGGSTVLSSNSWYHLSMTYDGSNFKGYINGQNEFSTPKTGTVISAGSLYFGHTLSGGEDSPMDGKISDVRIYDKALSAEEVSISYKYGLPNTGMQLSDDGKLYINKEINEGL
jgi:hypothetical protein